MGKIPWKIKCQPTPVFLLGESHGRRSLEGYNPWGHKESGHNWSDLAQNMQVKSHRPCLYTLPYCANVNNSNWFLWSSFLFYENQMFRKNIKLCINWESTGRGSVRFEKFEHFVCLFALPLFSGFSESPLQSKPLECLPSAGPPVPQSPNWSPTSFLSIYGLFLT